MATVHYDDISEGATYTSVRRTVTEADIVNFAGISGDYNALHIDEVFCAEETPFGTRIAHGLLTTAIGSGLHSDLANWQVLALLECHRRFVGPVVAGDTIGVEYRVGSKRESTTTADRGIVCIEVRVVNSQGKTVQEGEDTLLVTKRTEENKRG